MDQLLWVLFGAIVLGYPVNLIATWTAPRLAARWQERGNKNRTRSLAQLDKEEARVRRFHQDTETLAIYALLCFSSIAGLFFFGLFITLLLFTFAAISEESVFMFGLSAGTLLRGFGISLGFLILVIVMNRLLDLNAVLLNVYAFTRWERYVAERRAEFTK